MSTEIPYLLAIESSCDDTSAAVLQGDKVLSNVIASQKIHQEYGGVVPELASRAHQQHIVPVVHQALQRYRLLPLHVGQACRVPSWWGCPSPNLWRSP